VLKLNSSLRKFYGHHHDLVNLYKICVTNNHGYVLFVVITIDSFPIYDSWSTTTDATSPFLFMTPGVLRRMSHVEHELLTLPEHLHSLPILSGGSCCSIFSLLCNFFVCLWIIVCPFVPFVLAIVFYLWVQIIVLVSSNVSYRSESNV
jgi:hypothetical protein